MRRPRLTVRSIAQAVSQYYGIGWNDLASARRTADVVRARQILMFLCREHTTLSLPQIGRRVGGRDHTTVLHSCRKIEHLRDTDAEVHQELREVEALVYEREASLASCMIVPEQDIDPFEIAERVMAERPSDWGLTVSELQALAQAVILRKPVEEDDGDAAPVAVATPEPTPPAPAPPASVPAPPAPQLPAKPVIPPPVAGVLKAFRNLESARFSARERAERAAFERALNTLSSHFKTETNHAGH